MRAIPLRLPLVVGAWLLTTVLLLACLYFLQRSFARLRDLHNAQWQSLGGPDVFSGNGAFYPARKFIWSKRCHDLGDAVLVRQARMSYRLGMAAVALGLALIGILAYNAIVNAV